MANIKYISKFAGYSNYSDPTNTPVNFLIAGSQNVFIEDGAKLEPRAGMAYLGDPGTQGTQSNPYWTLAHRIHSKYDEFVNKQGITMPIRVYYDGRTAVGDVIETYLPDYIFGVAQTTKKWYRITALTPTLPIVSTHRYFWAEWFDPLTTTLQPELIFTYGGNKIGNYSGGFAPIVTITPTTLQTVPGTTWEQQGFIWAPEGTNIITVNGIEHTVTGGFGTDTVIVASTAGISVNDVAFQNVYFNDTLGGKTTYDVCSLINNQVYYLDWKQRNGYVSWNRNQLSSVSTTVFNGVGLDDGIIGGTYTGANFESFKVTIDTVSPDITDQEFIPGTGSLNDGKYNTGGYTDVSGNTNVYKVAMLADLTLAAVVGGGTLFTVGDTVVGTTSKATGVIVAILGTAFVPIYLMRMTTGFGYSNAEILTASSTGFINNQVASQWQNSIQYSKNNVVVNINNGSGSLPITPLNTTLTTLSDGLTIQFANLQGHGVGDVFQLTMRRGGVDTFQFSQNGGALSAPISITTGAQTLADGVEITFSNKTGHTIGDSFSAFGTQAISRGWSNFTYDNPNRLPGQGFNFLLDSNGWTMKPQETWMLLNSASGHFYDIETKLSANLLSETITVTRLKSEPQNKVLFPYLINYIKNQLATVSHEKTFDILGRQKFLELQQSKTLSDAVRIDFETVDWEDADVLYFKRKIFFNVPRTTDAGKGGCIFVWDDYRKYWHTPMVFSKRISLLSVIDNVLVGHSYEQNESYQLFTGLSDLGTFPIRVRGVLPYDSSGNRYNYKAVSSVGFEGYMDGNPEVEYTINIEVGGCKGQKKGLINPLNTPAGICLPADRASLGKSSLGFHGLGNDPITSPPHFFYIQSFDNQPYYQRNIEFSCDLFDAIFSLISLGTSVDTNNTNNMTITDKSPL